MSNQIEEYINELSKIIDNHIKKDGSFTTEVPSLFFNRVFSNIGPQYATYRTSFCFTVQGEKEIVFGQELKTSPKSLIDFKDCLAVGSSFLNQLAIFAINNNLKDKLNIVSDNNVVSDKYKKYLKTNKVE